MATPKQSKKQTSVAKKSSTKSTETNNKENNVSKAEKANINQLLAQAFYRFGEQEREDTRIKHKELEHLAKIIEEYLSAFVLIGYTLQDEEVVMFNAPTSKDEAALVDLLRSTFIDIASKRP